MKVLVTGGQNWDDYERILRELQKFPAGTIIVHGACKGADIIAGELAKELSFVVREYPADWTTYRRAAGPIRNRHMLNVEHTDDEPIDLVLAFHDNIGSSRGTKDMLNVATQAGIVCRLCTSKE